MSRIVVTEFISIDGVVEDPGGSEDLDRGGWAFQFSRGEEGDKFKFDETMGSAALLLGRVTYLGFAEAWPGRSDDAGFADKFNAMPKYVVSSTVDGSEWTNTTVLEGDPADSVAELRRSGPEGDVVVHGSPRLVQTLLAHDLVDELRLMVFPVLLGAGRRLWGELDGARTLELADARTVGDGVQILVYRRPE